MNEMIAFCGLACQECGAFLATMSNDDAKRREVAELWSKEHGAELGPQDINCNGCKAEEGPIFKYCETCEIRNCGSARGVENCAHCAEYACSRIEDFFAMVPDVKLTLDEIRKGL